MDTNHDGNISPEAGEASATLVLKTIVLAVDQQRHPVKLDSVHYPAIIEMKSGTGTIQIKASAEFPPVIPGTHQLYFQNQHQTNISVYLINAYVPKSRAIQITRQKRDLRQTEIWIDYTFAPAIAQPQHAPAGPSACIRRDPAGFALISKQNARPASWDVIS